MILETLDYAATWPLTPAPMRPHLASSVSLAARARRCRQAWAEHEANTKAHILARIDGLKTRRTAVVLGSGLLRDVPIRELSRAFDTVVLVDLVHLAQVRCWLAFRRMKTVRLISRDLSGLDETLGGKLPEPLGFLRQVPYLDFVVSANLLSQIGVGARRRLEAQGRTETTETIRPAIIKAHLDGLAGLPCRTALVTDIAYRVLDRQGSEIESDDLLAGVAVPDHVGGWDWPVVPFGEEKPDYQVIHRVIAA